LNAEGSQYGNVREREFVAGGVGHLILIVEDEPLIRLALSEYLQGCGYDVIEAPSADHATEILSTKPEIELVMTDVRMPGTMDGFALARWVRENGLDIPVIICSGNSNKAEAAERLCAKEPFLAKPYDLEAAAAQIREALNRKSAVAL
jgi:CheY-like chemotaxis protein